MHEVSRSFRAMNTDVLVVIAPDAARQIEAEIALYEVEMLFAEVERVASRFRQDSELSQLNRSAGEPLTVSPLLFALVAEALNAAQWSDGLFDPTILGSLLRAGYDRSFESLVEGKLPLASVGTERTCSWRDVQLDEKSRTIFLPRGCGLDLGGIGKGWTVDRAAAKLRRFGNYAVDAGGDIFAGGTQPDGSPWTIGVESPFLPEQNILVLEVRDRAVATSTVARRRWRQGGREQHHLIDPRTGRPAESGVVAATVVADTVARAEVLAKVALLLGPEDGRRLLESQMDADGVLVQADGGIWLSRNLSEAKHVA